MGICTAFVAKCLINVCNTVVGLLALAVGGLSAVAVVAFNQFADWVDPDAVKMMKLLVGGCVVVAALVAAGYVMMCCCWNKLFVYTYCAVGVAAFLGVITITSMGTNNLVFYQNNTKTRMTEAVVNYNYTENTDYDKKVDAVYFFMKCCGANDYKDFPNEGKLQLPAGCCKNYVPEVKIPGTTCAADASHEFYKDGCYAKLEDALDFIMSWAFKLGLFFALGLLGTLALTCICVTFTTIIPI